MPSAPVKFRFVSPWLVITSVLVLTTVVVTLLPAKLRENFSSLSTILSFKTSISTLNSLTPAGTITLVPSSLNLTPLLNLGLPKSSLAVVICSILNSNEASCLMLLGSSIL